MGFIKAFTGAISSTFADQWQDFYMPRTNVSTTAGIFQAVAKGTNNGVGENTKGNENIISNGTKIIVPEGTALITMQDGAITGFISEPGGYIFKSDDPNSQSMFAGDGIFAQTIKQTWEKVKFGGQPASQQLAFYVNLKEIPGIKFGTPGTIYWNDSYLELKAGGAARGSYSLKITDPLLFIKNFVPASYLQPGAKEFDFSDMDNEAGNQLFNEFVTCLTGAFSRFSSSAKENNTDTMEFIQSNVDKFSVTMNEEVENTYKWSSDRGLSILKVSIKVEYDQKTEEVLEEIRQDDKEIRKARRMGAAYSSNMAGMMAAASGQAMQSAASNENGAMMGFWGMNMAQQNGVNMMGAVSNMQQQTPVNNEQQPQMQGQAQPQNYQQPTNQVSEQAQNTQGDSFSKLLEMKKLLDAGAISQEEYDAVKKKVLGL